jgi:hypothetical protein
MRKSSSGTALWFKVAALVALAVGTAAAQQPPKPDLPPNPADLVRRAVANENKIDTHAPHYMFRLTKVKPDHSETREMIETDHGVVGRLLLWNGKPLSPEQRAKEDKRLQRLVDDPDQMAQKQQSQKADDRRTRNMVAALPDAFLYQYAGTREEAPWGELVQLKFKPNPDFDPPQHETMVYKGMQGDMAIAVPAYRIAKIEARLFRDVNFGWGILGHLDKGGQFVVEQKPVEGNDWVPTHMVLRFTGKVLIFKSLKINDDEITTGYRPVPSMSVAEAVNLLKKHDGELAKNSTSGSK